MSEYIVWISNLEPGVFSTIEGFPSKFDSFRFLSTHRHIQTEFLAELHARLLIHLYLVIVEFFKVDESTRPGHQIKRGQIHLEFVQKFLKVGVVVTVMEALFLKLRGDGYRFNDARDLSISMDSMKYYFDRPMLIFSFALNLFIVQCLQLNCQYLL